MILKSKNKNIDINKIVVSNKVCFGKKGFKYISLATKMLKKLIFIDISVKMSAYRKTLIKLGISLF